MRDAIFISHATPEDNDFSRWLAAKLTLAGYRVWFDLDRLKGGDVFWDKIESAIREESFRFVAVVSNNSYIKQGVRNEWELAPTVEKVLSGFLIPVRIDNFDFSKLPITMHRKNVIDFASGWHKGLSALLDTLSDANAPRAVAPNPGLARQWLAVEKAGSIQAIESPETLESMWLPILELPQSIESARILSSARGGEVTKSNRRLPWFEFGDRIVGFARASELVELMAESVMLKAAGGNETLSFISDGISWGENRVTVGDARYRVEYLIRQAWILAMENAGLKSYSLSGGRVVHYVTKELFPNGKCAFVDSDGRVRKKKLWGRSERRKANWHYGIGIRPTLDDPWRIELRATIVFTGDDGVPLEAARAHRLRMGFCRSWWNDRWRGFMRGFITILSSGAKDFSLPVGGDRFIRIGADPLTFVSPIRLTDNPGSIEEDAIEDLDEDQELPDDFDEHSSPEEP
jgi:hypothetical protein